MPTFGNIDGEESATVTFTVGAVSLTRNSSAELQEILCLGDPEVASSLGLARVTASAPASTNAGLNVRIVSGPSSLADFAVRAVLPSTYGDHGLRVLQSTAGDLNVTVAGYSTTVNVSSLAGPVIIRSTAADALVTAYQSTAGDLNMTAVPAAGSTWRSQPGSTLWASSAGFHFEASSGALLVAQGSTVWAVQVAGYSTEGLSRLADRDQSTQVANVTNTTPASTAYALAVREVAPTTTVQVSSVGGAVIVRSSAANLLASVYQSTAADLNVTVAGYSTTAQVSSVGGIVAVSPASSGATGFFAVRLSDGSTYVSDSTERAIRVNVVAGSAAGSTEATVRQSTYTDFNNLSRIADRDFSTQTANVTNTTPASTAYALAVREAAPTTTVQVSSVGGAVIVRSSAADNLGTVYQSTFADLRATVHNSTIGDLLASVQQNSTVWQVQAKIMDSSAVTPNIVGTRPTTGAQGFAVRTVLNDLQSTCFSTIGNNSTSATVVTSAASVRHKVYAYSITSTAQAINTLTFASSLANPLWQVQMQSVSSGIVGANLAVTPPAWLFATEVANPLVFKITGNTGSYHLSFSYFTEA